MLGLILRLKKVNIIKKCVEQCPDVWAFSKLVVTVVTLVTVGTVGTVVLVVNQG